MLEPTLPNVTVKALISVGDTLPNGYRFEAIPDGIGIDPRGTSTLDVYVNHETATIPFPFTFPPVLTDFDNAQLSRLTLKRGTGKVLDGEIVIGSDENYLRFCSSFMATSAEAFDSPLLFTGEESSDLVNRRGLHGHRDLAPTRRAWRLHTIRPMTSSKGSRAWAIITTRTALRSRVLATS